MKKLSPSIKYLLISLTAAILTGAATAAFMPGKFLVSWLSSGFLYWVSFYFGLRIWHKFSGVKLLAILMLVTFFIRLILGVALQQLLPLYGYENDVQNSGFVYSDPFNRDLEAVRIANSPDSLFTAFSPSQSIDQYGGLLFITSAAYRYLSPDVPRPLLITILGAMTMALGVAFLYESLKRKWGGKIAVIAAWVLALYSEGILLGSSQLREPFIIGLACISLWCAFDWHRQTARKIIYFLLSIAASCAFSIPGGLAVAAACLGFILIEWVLEQTSKARKLAGTLLLAVFAGISLIAGWLWLKPNLYYDAYLTETSSGLISLFIKNIGTEWRIPLVTAYGMFQPLLPAVIMDKSLPIWTSIGIFRAAGWYFVIPFLLYGFFAAWKAEPKTRKWQLIYTFVILLVWTVISSARAGGDQWDNPRYRAIMLPFLSIGVGWVWDRVRESRRPWFYRWIAVEGVFLLFVLDWYTTRNVLWHPRLPFLVLIGLIVVLSAAILGGGALYDFARERKRARITSKSDPGTVIS